MLRAARRLRELISASWVWTRSGFAYVLQGRTIAPATCMLEMASAAGKLLGSAADTAGAAVAVTNAALSSPLLLRQAAGGTAAVTCSLDPRSGRAQLQSSAATAVRTTVHLTGQLAGTAATAAALPQEDSSAQHPGISSSSTARALAVLLVALRGAERRAAGPLAVASGIDAGGHADSGYSTHPAVGDAAIHAGAAAREAGDTTFLVSAAVGAYCTPQALSAGGAFTAVQLSPAAADGSVLSSHRLHSGGGAGSRPGIAGVHAQPMARAGAAAAGAAQAPAQATAVAPAGAGIAVPAFDATYVDPPPQPRVLPDTMPPLQDDFLAQVSRIHQCCPRT